MPPDSLTEGSNYVMSDAAKCEILFNHILILETNAVSHWSIMVSHEIDSKHSPE